MIILYTLRLETPPTKKKTHEWAEFRDYNVLPSLSFLPPTEATWLFIENTKLIIKLY